jgi:outer membrane protein
MRVCVLVMALSTALAATSLEAQTKPAPTQPAPTQPAPPKPMTPAPAPPTATPPAPFPEGAKIAWVDLQRVANESKEGQASTAKVQALNTKKVTELNEKNKMLQAQQQKLQTGGSVLSDEARSQLEKDINRLQREIQNFTQEAQEEVQELQQGLQNEFTRKLLPVVDKVASEKGLHMVLSRADAGIIWAPALDITAEVIKRLDGAGGAAPKP